MKKVAASFCRTRLQPAFAKQFGEHILRTVSLPNHCNGSGDYCRYPRDYNLVVECASLATFTLDNVNIFPS